MKNTLYLIFIYLISSQCADINYGSEKGIKWPKLEQSSRDYILNLRDSIEDNSQKEEDIYIDDMDYLDQINFFNDPQVEYGPNILIHTLQMLGFEETSGGLLKIKHENIESFDDKYQEYIKYSVGANSSNNLPAAEESPKDSNEDSNECISEPDKCNGDNDNNYDSIEDEAEDNDKDYDDAELEEEKSENDKLTIDVSEIDNKSDNSEWECDECTFINSSYLPQCEMCTSSKQLTLVNDNHLKYSSPIDIIYIGGMDCENKKDYWGSLKSRFSGFDPFDYCSNRVYSRKIPIMINAHILNESIKRYFTYHRYEKVLFICHSMGGIYSSYIDLIPDSLIYIAVPHQGVRYNEFIRDRVIPGLSSKFDNITLGHDIYKKCLLEGIPRTRTIVRKITRTIQRKVSEYKDDTEDTLNSLNSLACNLLGKRPAHISLSKVVYENKVDHKEVSENYMEELEFEGIIDLGYDTEVIVHHKDKLKEYANDDKIIINIFLTDNKNDKFVKSWSSDIEALIDISSYDNISNLRCDEDYDHSSLIESDMTNDSIKMVIEQLKNNR